MCESVTQIAVTHLWLQSDAFPAVLVCLALVQCLSFSVLHEADACCSYRKLLCFCFVLLFLVCTGQFILTHSTFPPAEWWEDVVKVLLSLSMW